MCGECMAYRRLHDYRHKKHMQLMLRRDKHFSAFYFLQNSAYNAGIMLDAFRYIPIMLKIMLT